MKNFSQKAVCFPKQMVVPQIAKPLTVIHAIHTEPRKVSWTVNPEENNQAHLISGEDIHPESQSLTMLSQYTTNPRKIWKYKWIFTVLSTTMTQNVNRIICARKYHPLIRYSAKYNMKLVISASARALRRVSFGSYWRFARKRRRNCQADPVRNVKAILHVLEEPIS